MPLPWLQIIDAVVGVANFARSRRAGIATDEQQQQQQMEAALKEAFDRDTRRLELERDQLAAERERAERALRLELQRQAADREIGRLRLLAGIAIAGWLVTLLLAIWPGSRMVATITARVALGGGWLLLGAALAASFSAQARVAAVLDPLSGGGGDSRGAAMSGPAGPAALWLIVSGLTLVGLAALIA